MDFKRSASANWEGNLKEGKGYLSTESSVLKDAEYSFDTRFEDKPGTNPEELIGAAHAGCFSMQLAANLAEAGFTPENIETKATVHFKGKEIAEIKLNSIVSAESLTNDKLNELAADAKENCPVSKLLNTTISLDIDLK